MGSGRIGMWGCWRSNEGEEGRGDVGNGNREIRMTR